MARKKNEETPAPTNTNESPVPTTTTREDLVAAGEDMNTAMGLEPAIDVTMNDADLEAKVAHEAKQVVKEDHPDHPLTEKETAAGCRRLTQKTWDFLTGKGFFAHLAPAEPAAAAPAAGGKGKSKAKGDGAAAGNGKPRGNATPGKGPGVIAAILTILQATTATTPITKAGIVDKLKAQFPDRDADSMKSTVNVQVPSRMAKEKNVKIISGENGYYIEK